MLLKKTRPIGLLLIIIAVVLIFCPALVLGQEISLGVRGSYYSPDDADDEWLGGIQLRLLLTQKFGLEGSIDYRSQDVGETEIHIYPVQVSLLGYLLSGQPIRVFWLGGAGWYFTDIDFPDPLDDSTENRFGLHAGAGVEFMLNEFWSIDGTYRYIWIENLESENEDLLDKEFSDQGHQVTIGLNYHF